MVIQGSPVVMSGSRSEPPNAAAVKMEGTTAEERGLLPGLEKNKKQILPPERNWLCQRFGFSPVRPVSDLQTVRE